MQGAHQRELAGAEQERHVPHLVAAHPVFTRDRAPCFDAEPHDLFACLFDPRDLVRVSPVEEEIRVQVTVPGMKEIGEPKPVRVRDPANLRENSNELGAWNYGILDEDVGRRPTQGAVCLLPGPPDREPFLAPFA